MKNEAVVRVELELTEQEAWDLAQLHKRLYWGQFRDCAADSDEAYRMIAVSDKLRIALAKEGIAPR